MTSNSTIISFGMSESNNKYNIKFEYLYGIAGPEKPDIYQKISAYAFKNKLVPEDFIEDDVDFELLRTFFRKIEDLTGFKHLDFEGVWDPDTKASEAILVLARKRAPTDEEEIKKIKHAVKVIKRELELEETEKWYVEDSDAWDQSHFPEKFNPPPRFT